MTVPLVILAVFAVFLGWVGTEVTGNPFERFVHYSGAPAPPFVPWVELVTTAVALAGWGAAGAVYLWRVVPPEALRRQFPAVYALLARRYYVDDVYGWVFLRAGGALVWLAGACDRYVVDGLVNLVGWLARQTGWGLRYVQTGRAETYLLLVALGVVVIVLVRLVW